MTHTPDVPVGSYRVSAELLARPDFRAACSVRDFGTIFRLMRKYDGASQDRISSPVDGLSQSRVSRIARGEDRIASLDLIERIADALRIPGGYFGLAPRRWESTTQPAGPQPVPAQASQPVATTPPAQPVASSGGLIVEVDEATLRYDDATYYAHQMRRIVNTGTEPVTRYLMRISVDRYPGDPERSARLYRAKPLRWDFLWLSATCNGEPMNWKIKTDWDALKEVWLCFENSQGHFPLYPGDTAVIEYSYRVSDDRWGPWFQRAVRVPTRSLSVRLDFPAEVDPVVWGMETSMTAEALPFRTAIARTETAGRRVFSWSTDEPPLHARYRLEWNFRAQPDPAAGAARPSEQMAAVGIVQQGAEILSKPARPFDLPAEAEDARRVVAELSSAIERVSALHTFGKGMGIAAPQVGINRAAAIVRTVDGDTITLLNPTVIEASPETDEQYEGCLSFFDVRGLVPRPLTLHVEHADIDGTRRITVFEKGLARLVAHEIDHLDGHLYTDKMRPGVTPIPVEQYRGVGSAWTYTST
ncbi:peptide deformylase [Candidatus Protofrankia californiensis]|uniref:peptide deformylase n=1 Tax=Candidatus Protofrankia californiensis TaxID=1839754 RepID=UPI00104153AF|nr:peptide deformylase [Candidatus Protofrankia californiensis]